MSSERGLCLANITVTVRSQGETLPILDVPALAIDDGARIGLAGPSGSGKTSLLHIIAGLLRPDRGTVMWDGSSVSELGEAARACWRRQVVGMVFQDFLLVPEMTALANVLLPCSFSGVSARDQQVPAIVLLRELGITTPARRAAAMSRGEQQRVAIARALLVKPKLILADEPTASLDATTAAAITDLLVTQAAATGATLVVVSHDAQLLARMDRVVHLDRGRLA